MFCVVASIDDGRPYLALSPSPSQKETHSWKGVG